MRLSIGLRRLLAAATCTIVALLSSVTGGTPASAATVSTPAPGKPVVLAHYYIWFDRTSWNRAKRDYPLAGRYSSDDADVMRQQIEQAKNAGIGGFIVSWKSTPVLDARLRTLVAVAQTEHFKLAITYQGLTFDRINLPGSRIAADLDAFVRDYAGNPVFDIFGKPLVVLTGTPGMTTDEVRSVVQPRRQSLLVLATEKNVQGYLRLAGIVDGDLYYWSSVNPTSYPDFAAKLASMGNAVRGQNGIWIAPAAPGFDARLLSGHSVVDRQGGSTLRTEWSAAVDSLPAAIGIISWNEYSENTYIEPSKRYGDLYLKEVRALTGAQVPSVPDFDSNEPIGLTSVWRPAGIFGGVVALLILCSVVAVRRRRTAT
jgi:hypothetical protein